jgi:hypothetical protein
VPVGHDGLRDTALVVAIDTSMPELAMTILLTRS